MKAKRALILPVIAMLAFTCVGIGVAGQDDAKRTVATHFFSDGSVDGQFEIHLGDQHDGSFFTVMSGDKMVKGAPYSAQAVSESVQTLSDGNRIVRRTTTNLYRDSEGRTRRETFKRGAAGSTDEVHTIFINDPVANASYVLNTTQKTARKMATPKILWRSSDGENRNQEATVEIHRVEEKVKEKVKDKQKEGASTGLFEHHVITRGGGGMGVHSGSVIRRAEKGVKESLGKQVFDGVEAEGTRTTHTIPAGEIGNEQPINIVSERWYSPELQMTVMTRHFDPRLGESTYRLTNISRNEPARSLFEVPADYTVQTGVERSNVIKKRRPSEQ
jgi:hypothetical protein